MNVIKNFMMDGKVAIVTGGNGLLGRKFGEALYEAGAHVILADIKDKKVIKGGKKQSKKGSISFVKTDVTDQKSIEVLCKAVVKRFRRIDVLVNSAIGVGENHFGPVEKCAKSDWDQVMNVNVWGAFLFSRIVAKQMKKQQKGSIINIGSIYGVVGADQRIYGKSGINSPAVYAASKGAIINLTRYLSVYWAASNIRVNTISPGGVFNNQEGAFLKKYSNRTPLGRMLKKEELKGAVLFLASDASSYMTGHNLILDGGWTVW